MTDRQIRTPQATWIGDEIRRRRVAAHLTRRELAAKCGWSTTSITDWENGHRTPSATAARETLRALGADLAVVDHWGGPS